MVTPTLRMLTAVLAFGLLFTAVPQASAQGLPETAAAESAFVNMINAERRKSGLSPLVENAQMTRVARAWSTQMAAGKGLAHNPSRSAQVQGPWRALGENVGTHRASGVTAAQLVDRLHASLMSSAGHRKNILDRFNQVGIGVVIGRDGTMWVTQNFLNGPIGAFPLFADTWRSPHAASIEAIWRGGITTGCKGGTAYCPANAVSRGEMATFLSRGLGLASSAERFGFTDVAGVHAGSIDALAKAGITGGCATGKFCPDKPVTRAQMASFLTRALKATDPSGHVRFADVPPTHSHAASISALAAAGITTGCGGDRFCPAQVVTRAQMSTFLARALAL